MFQENNLLGEDGRTINEKSTPVYSFQLQDTDGTNLDKTEIAALAMYLYDIDSGEIINSRDNQDILDDNNVTVGATGLVEWTMQEDDTAIIGTHKHGKIEKHRAEFILTLTNGQTFKYGELFDIVSFTKTS